MKYVPEEAMRQLEQEIANKKQAIFDLIEHNEMLDDDGYPTGAALDVVKLWHWNDARGWFKFIEGIWHLRSWGWKEAEQDHEWNDHEQYKDKMVHRYYISTAGWSGNESIIGAMQDNDMMWHLTWVQSRRGGHYIFELKEFDNE